MILAADDHGDGAAVVLLHAEVADRRMWNRILTPLGRTFRVIAADLRGHGDSPLPDGAYTDADDVVALLDARGVDRAAVVGAASGARVALETATRHPGRVRELVLLCPDVDGIEPTRTWQAVQDSAERFRATGNAEALVRLGVDTWLGPEASTSMREALAGMARRGLELWQRAHQDGATPHRQAVALDLGRVAVPVHVVSGALDIDHARLVAKHLVAHIAGAEHTELDWAAHLPAMERPDAILALLLDVLRDDPDVHAP